MYTISKTLTQEKKNKIKGKLKDLRAILALERG